MKRIALFFICISLIVSCKKNDSDNTPISDSTTSVDYLSDEQLQILDNAGIDTTTKFNDLLFPDSTKIIDWENSNDSGYLYVFDRRVDAASDKKKLFIDAMMRGADMLTNKDSYRIITNQKNGLAYVYGSRHLKDPAISQQQDNGKPAVCQQALYGLDCNGMIYQMATAGGLNLKEGSTTTYSKVETWNTAFNDPSSSDFNGLQMMDLKNLDWNLVQAGDIVVSIGSHNHIGMIYDNGKFKGMAHSHGSPRFTCDENTALKRGPDKTPQLLNWVKEMFGSNYHILRVVQNGKPGLSTTKITSITETTAVSGGSITNDGGFSITAKGVCWSTLPNPTIALATKTNDGTGSENFTSNITGLTANQTYHVKAYATNSTGTSYGKEINFIASNVTLNNTLWEGTLSTDLSPQPQPVACYLGVSNNNIVSTGLANESGYYNMNYFTGVINSSQTSITWNSPITGNESYYYFTFDAPWTISGNSMTGNANFCFVSNGGLDSVKVDVYHYNLTKQ